MHLKIITQRQIIPISTATENKPIKTFRKVLLTHNFAIECITTSATFIY